MQMFQNITLDLVERLSTAKTLLKGENYYDLGAVRKITYHEDMDRIAAMVRGQASYTVTVVNVSGEPVFICTCPVGGGNICKHGVAVALEIINNPETVKIERVKETSGEPSEKPGIDIETLFKKATAKQREEFLLEVLKEDDSYREKFRVVVMGQSAAESKTSVEEIRDAVKEEFENFDLVNYERFYDRHNPSSGYREEWEILYNGASEELNEIAEEYLDEIRDHLKSGNIVDASKNLLGLYEGISLIDEDEIEDEACIYEDRIVGELLDMFSYFLREFVGAFAAKDKDEDALMRISEIVFERIRYYRQNADRYENFEYNLVEFKAFFKELVCGPKTAEYWNSELKSLDLTDNSTDEIRLKIAERLKDGKSWLKIAESTFTFNPAVAHNLLEFYKEKKDDGNFIRVGKFVLNEWGDRFDGYLYESLDREKDPGLFSDVLFHYAAKKESIPLFREYKKIFGQDGADAFIAKIEDNSRLSLYYIRLLKEEKDYATILKFAKSHVDDWDFIEYISPVVRVYPAECFNIIRRKTDRYLANTLGRSSYRTASQWLKLLLEIDESGLCEEIQRYFNSLFTLYNCRPALKDELRKAGISSTY
jgi:hypothetical protein